MNSVKKFQVGNCVFRMMNNEMFDEAREFYLKHGEYGPVFERMQELR